MSNQLARALGRNIRTRRTAMGISQERLAEAAKIHRTYLMKLESGTGNPTIRSLCLVAQALRVDVPTLLAEATS